MILCECSGDFVVDAVNPILNTGIIIGYINRSCFIRTIWICIHQVSLP